MERVPGRDEIDLPLRGPALRDRYVLRLIALDRALHLVLLTLLAVAFLTFAGHDQALHTEYENLMNALNGGGVAASKVRGLLGYLGRAFKYSPTHLVELALIFLALAAVELTEAVGLWLNKRWAEYLTFVVTALFIPYEIYELALKVSVLKIVALVVNVLVVAYLLWAKRLFGLRGGHGPKRNASGDSAGGRRWRTPNRAYRRLRLPDRHPGAQPIPGSGPVEAVARGTRDLRGGRSGDRVVTSSATGRWRSW